MDAVDRLLAAEPIAGRLAVLDAPALSLALADETPHQCFCDDRREWDVLPPDLRVASPGQIAGVDVGWLRLPRAGAALDEMAGLLIGAGARQVVGGGRVKHMTRSMNAVLGARFERVSASLGVGKARLLRASGPLDVAPPAPRRRWRADLGLTLVAHGGVFAGARLDPGTRLLLAHLGEVGADRVIDLGCGNGVLALTLASLGHDVLAIDVSHAAVASTREGARANSLRVATMWADGLSGVPDGAADAIVCHPPFHRGAAKQSEPTIAMLTDAGRALRPGGEIWCVFNSHLPWRSVLERAVGPTKLVDQDPGYTLVRAVRRG